MEFSGWNENREFIFSELKRVALGKSDVNVVALSNRVALGLPKNRKLASEVVNLYRPMKWKARVVASALGVFVKLGGAFLFGSRRAEEGKAEIPWLTNASSIGFLGCNPEHGLRCVALSQESDGPIKVTKFAIGENLKPVLAEGEFLRKIDGKYAGVPWFGGRDEGKGWAAFYTGYVSKVGPRRVGGKSVINLLRGWLGTRSVALGDIDWLRPILFKAAPAIKEKLKREEVREALVHGDFAPWNLRRNDTGLVAIDWEWAHYDGFGGLDLGHGMIMEAVMVNGLSGENLIVEILSKAGRAEESSYLVESGWNNVNLWLSLSLLYSSQLAGIEMEMELNILKDWVGQSTVI